VADEQAAAPAAPPAPAPAAEEEDEDFGDWSLDVDEDGKSS